MNTKFYIIYSVDDAHARRRERIFQLFLMLIRNLNNFKTLRDSDNYEARGGLLEAAKRNTPKNY